MFHLIYLNQDETAGSQDSYAIPFKNYFYVHNANKL